MNKIAKYLLETKSVFLEPSHFFTWTSGIKSPIYCDNRQLISYPEARKYIVNKFIHEIKKSYPKVELIAATATAGISWGAWIAHELNLPLVYVRSKSKKHGRKNAIEGSIRNSKNCILIEDLISTGKSSINAAMELKESGLEVLSILSIFNYGLNSSIENFISFGIKPHSLCTLNQLLDFSLEGDLLSKDEIAIINNWKSEQ